ncbi:MAG: hypothetical protein GY701_24735 [Sulfitobacter sp.]|nr:hypothetical protein [Sulfitobacter sp.]
MPSFDEITGASGQLRTQPPGGVESQKKGQKIHGRNEPVLQKLEHKPNDAGPPMKSRAPALASGQNDKVFTEIQSLLTEIKETVADANRGNRADAPPMAAKPVQLELSNEKEKKVPRQIKDQQQPLKEEEEEYLDPSARPNAFKAWHKGSARGNRQPRKSSNRSDRSDLGDNHPNAPDPGGPPKPSSDLASPPPPDDHPPSVDRFSRQAHMEQEAESQARTSLGRNVKSLLSPFVDGGRSLYRSVRGHEQAGTATLDGMRRGSKLQRLMDARNAMSDVNRHMIRRQQYLPNFQSESVDWDYWRKNLASSTHITDLMQRKSAAAERIVNAKSTLEEHGIDPDWPIDRIRAALDVKVRDAADAAKAGATGSPPRPLRMAVRDELPRLGSRLNLGDNPLNQVDALNRIVDQSNDKQMVKDAKRALHIGRELIEHGLDPTRPRAEIQQGLENRLTDGDRLKELSRAADRLQQLSSAQRKVRELRIKVPANALPNESKQIKRDRLELERNARIVARLGPLHHSLITEAVQRHAQLSARCGMTYGADAEAFKRSQLDRPIGRKGTLFKGKIEAREAAIDEAARQLDADKQDPDADPHSFYRREEELLMARESVVRDRIKDLEQRWKTGLYTSGKRLEWISRSLAGQKARLQELLGAKQGLGNRRSARLAQLNNKQLLKYANAYERIVSDFDEVRHSLGVAKELSETKSGWLASAGKAVWRGIKAIFNHPNEVKEISKLSSDALDAHMGIHHSAEAAEAGMDHAAIDTLVVEKFFGAYKSAVAFGKNIRNALKTGDIPEPPGGSERGTAPWHREAPYRMLASNREAVKEHLPDWALYEMVEDGAATVRYGGEAFTGSAQIAAKHGQDAAHFVASAGMQGALKATPIAGGALATSKAVKKSVQAGIAASENSKRGKALKQTRTEFADNDNPVIADSLKDLENLHALAKEKSDVKTKLVGAGKDLVHAGGYAVAAVAVFGVGGTALATVAAPVAAGVAAGAALAYAVGKQVKAYNRRELLKLHQDALIGRIGDKTAQKLLKEARAAGFDDPRDYLDQQLMRQDARYATQRVVMNLKREIRANTRLGHGGMDDYIEQRVGSATLGAEHASVRRDAQGNVDIYSDPVYRDEDKRRLDASPTAGFLLNMGMTQAQVLALADSRDDAESIEATRMLIQTHLKIKG